MKRILDKLSGGNAAALAALVALQAVAAVFFVGDVVADLHFDGFDPHVVLEAVVAASLVVGVAFGALEMRRAIQRAQRSERALASAQTAMGELVRLRFAEWGLTPSEHDVAFFALKGFDPAGIAELRGAAPGTVRAQLSRVYAKAGVSSQVELLALFIDDLLAGPGVLEQA